MRKDKDELHLNMENNLEQPEQSVGGTLNFDLLSRDSGSPARSGLIRTPHGFVSTPAFMPVGTAAAVKTLSPEDLRKAGVEIVLANTYHIHHQPGEEVVARAGGLARFMSWNGPTLTDSGGFQVFSLSATRKVEEEGVIFQSVYDGRSIKLTPESVYAIERAIGADIIYALDECPPYPAEHREVERATDLSVRWAERFLKEHKRIVDQEGDRGQTPFPVVQGGLFDDLRLHCIESLEALDPIGYGIGGVSVGEPPEEMIRIAGICCEALPDDKPRHLLGVGTPKDLLGAIGVGVDLFDCVLPTRNGRNGQAFTSSGVVNLRLARWKLSQDSLDPKCTCPACREFGISYLHHLMNAGELLGLKLISLHNIAYYQKLMRAAREAIVRGEYRKWRNETEYGWSELGA